MIDGMIYKDKVFEIVKNCTNISIIPYTDLEMKMYLTNFGNQGIHLLHNLISHNRLKITKNAKVKLMMCGRIKEEKIKSLINKGYLVITLGELIFAKLYNSEDYKLLYPFTLLPKVKDFSEIKYIQYDPLVNNSFYVTGYENVNKFGVYYIQADPFWDTVFYRSMPKNQDPIDFKKAQPLNHRLATLAVSDNKLINLHHLQNELPKFIKLKIQ